MNDYTFTKIEQENKAKTVLPKDCFSISKTGRIGLGRQFSDEHDLTADTRAVLYWDDEQKAIAITFTTHKQQTAGTSFTKVNATEGYTVAFVAGGAGYIPAHGFFKAIGADPTEHAGYHHYDTLNPAQAGVTDADGDVFVMKLV